MKIAIHSHQLDQRGTGKVPCDYARGLRAHTGHEVMIVTSSLSPNESLPRVAKEFPVLTYDKKVDVNPAGEVRAALEQLVRREKIDFMHFIKYGHDDQITPQNCRSGIHCVFIMAQPHGDVYAGVSSTLAKKFGQTLHVPHIIKSVPPTQDMRKKLGLPVNAFVVGRHGGFDTFDVPFVHDAVREALTRRPDLYFVFLSTKPFVEHERVIHIPWVETEQEKADIIHGCDAMLHARMMGETFGLAVGEFSAANKPVITWSGRGHAGYDRAHLDILGSKAMQYHQKADLVNILLKLDRKFTTSLNWDVYTQRFSEATVTRQYQEVFLSAAATPAPAAIRSTSVTTTAAVRPSPSTKPEPSPAKNHMNYFQHLLLRLRARGIKPAGFIDAGAHYGETNDIIRMIYPGIRIVSFEANPNCEKILAQKGIEYRIGLLGNKSSEKVPFYTNPDDVASTGCSIFKENSKFFSNARVVELPMHRLDDVVPINTKFDFLKMDVQGAELRILDGAEKLLPAIKWIFLEVSFADCNQGAPLFGEVFDYLRSKGFQIADLCEPTWVENQLVQCNFLFERSAEK
jgi:FkbM family methyltransferase